MIITRNCQSVVATEGLCVSSVSFGPQLALSLPVCGVNILYCSRLDQESRQSATSGVSVLMFLSAYVSLDQHLPLSEWTEIWFSSARPTLGSRSWRSWLLVLLLVLILDQQQLSRQNHWPIHHGRASRLESQSMPRQLRIDDISMPSKWREAAHLIGHRPLEVCLLLSVLNSLRFLTHFVSPSQPRSSCSSLTAPLRCGAFGGEI